MHPEFVAFALPDAGPAIPGRRVAVSARHGGQ